MSFGLFSIFGAGMLTFLTPCVLPLIPIYLAALTGGSVTALNARQKGALMLKASAFSLGFIVVFSALGFGASSIGAFFGENKLLFKAVGGLVIAVFGLKFLGVINIPFLDRIVKGNDQGVQTRFGLVNAFLMGIVFAAGWSPCVGPVLGSILTYTVTEAANPYVGAGYLALYGLGFAVPLLLVAAFAEAGQKFIMRVSPWLPKIERGIGVLLLFVGGMLLFEATAEIRNTSQVSSEAVVELQDVEEGAEKLPMMIELYKDDCPVCKKMKPTLDGIMHQCDKKGVRVKALNISEPQNRHLVEKYRLIGVPTFIFVDEDGMETTRLVGAQSEQTLKQSLSALRGEPCPGVGKVERELLDNAAGKPSMNCGI